MKTVKTAVIGCGAISDIYLENMTGRYSTLQVTACAANHIESAVKKAEKYGIRAMTTDEVLADPEIELVVVLTPVPSHYELIKKALNAGKHVYTEKTLALTLEQAEELSALAKEKGLRLGSAPETFLGSAWQTARKAIDEGLCGEVTSFHITANRDLTVLAGLFHFLRQPGGGICQDYGVYYLTALVSLLGPVKQVYAVTGNHAEKRINPVPFSPEYGKEFEYANEAQVNALITLENGVTGTFSLNGDSAMQDQAYFTIHGTKGILQLSDANAFGGQIRFLKNDPRQAVWQTLQPVSDLSDNCRGIGPADMGYAIRHDVRHFASEKLACHVLDTIEMILQSGKNGQVCLTRATCERPEPFDRWKGLLK